MSTSRSAPAFPGHGAAGLTKREYIAAQVLAGLSRHLNPLDVALVVTGQGPAIARITVGLDRMTACAVLMADRLLRHLDAELVEDDVAGDAPPFDPDPDREEKPWHREDTVAGDDAAEGGAA